jgi:hypothetical protein
MLAPMTPSTKINRTGATQPRLAEMMESTRQASAAAHDVFLRAAIEGARWERRGFLGRLTRSDL